MQSVDASSSMSERFVTDGHLRPSGRCGRPMGQVFRSGNCLWGASRNPSLGQVSQDEDVRDVEFDNPRIFVTDLLTEAGLSEFDASLSYPGRPTRIATELLAVVEALGGTVERDGAEVDRETIGQAGLLIPGTRMHLRLRSASWQSLLALVPIVATFALTGGLTLAVFSAAPLLGIITDKSTWLTEDEKLVYLAVAALARTQGRGVAFNELRSALATDASGEVWDSKALRKTLDRLATQQVIADTESGYQPVF
jgi:hypothetical protein